eukprot:tig00000158_g10206.t1
MFIATDVGCTVTSPGDGLPGVADVVATVTGVLTARVVVRFRYNGGVSMTSAAASCGPLAGGPAEWSAVTAVQSGAWSATFLASGLQPNTTYVCWANATNGAGTSANVWSGNFTTYSIRIDAAMLATAPASMSGRINAASALFRNGSSGYKLFVAGGWNGGSLNYNDAAVLDIDSNSWTKLSWTLPASVNYGACAWDELDTIYCADDTNFWSYSTSSLTATALEDVPLAITINCATFWNNSFWVMSDATANMYRLRFVWCAGKHLTEIDGLPRVADVVATVTGVRTARVVVRFRYNGGVSMTSAAASCGPLAGGPAEWSAVTAVQSGAWSATFLASGLQPNTTYVCWANATNGAGTSANVWSGNFTTYTEGIRIDAAKLATAPASMSGRVNAASALFRNGSSSYKLFVAGGSNGGSVGYIDAAVLDIDSNSWTKLSWTLPASVTYGACAWDELDTIYCADDTNFWSYSTSSLTATTLEDVPLAITINCATFWNNSFWV